ncbi:PD-(D/E)XK nuclease-like domain-containing protein [Paenibacillus alvei]|uniref:Phage related protein n=1 Tax=Paenibacillus alvei TaxID=44250 RepID=A0A383RE87_PAEAL|nr:PD-(D/E)XK nuclease-like domain-containing protein [Paenibacillus alvei]SYX84649.1 Phage related protein [Paenibacillus alvei]
MAELLKLTKDNYFSLEANRQYMSVSQFKGFLPAYGGCEAQSMAKLAGEWEDAKKDAFDEGHFLHAWNEGTLSEFKANNPQIYSSRGNTAGQLKSNFKHLNKLIDVLESDPMVMNVLAGQKEVILSATLYGIPWKVMLDSYQPDIAVLADLKGMQSMDSKWWNVEARCYENFIEHYGYDIQMSIYAEVEKHNKAREHWAIPHMVIVTKETVPNHEIIFFDYEDIARGLNIVANNIERVKAVKSGLIEPTRCENCDYCKTTKKITRIKQARELSLY